MNSGRQMWKLAGVAVGLTLAAPAFAAAPVIRTEQVFTATSRSTQFIIQGRANPGPPPSPNAPKDSRISVTPDLLAVSCERIKAAFLGQLQLPDRWQGKVHIGIVPATAMSQGVGYGASLFRDGFQYRLEVPQRVEPERLVRAVVQVLLQELANRGATKSAEIPLWLREGMTQELLSDQLINLVAQESTSIKVGGAAWMLGTSYSEGRKGDNLDACREYLKTHPALTFMELSLPTSGQLENEGWTGFQRSSQLFYHSLIGMRGGPALLVTFIQQLNSQLNWQTPFLKIYGAQFSRLLDVEKWWAVNVASLSGRDQSRLVSREVCQQKLDDILFSEANVRMNSDTMPTRVKLRLQDVILTWDVTRQRLALGNKVSQLSALGLSAPEELMPLVFQYRDILAYYLKEHDKASLGTTLRGQPVFSATVLARSTAKKLDELDLKLANLREATATAVARNDKPANFPSEKKPAPMVFPGFPIPK